MSGPGAVGLAAALAAAASDAELAALARAEAEADGTQRLREAVDLLRAAARGEAVPAPALDPGALGRITRLVGRDEALEALYEAEARGRPPTNEGRDEGAAALAREVWGEHQDLDAAIGAAATDWRVERMAAVDRAVLRLALWELRHRPDLSAAVVISEAVRLAKAYSTERSGAFVNGVLSRLEREREGEERA
jgi:transcription antitermination protein NusB